MSPPTRPRSSDPAEIARWDAEVRANAERLQKQSDFEDRMLQFAARTDTTLTHVVGEMKKHAEDDREQFRREQRARRRLARRVEELGGQVTQTVNSNKYNWGVVAVWVSAFVTVAATGWALYQTFGGVLKQ